MLAKELIAILEQDPELTLIHDDCEDGLMPLAVEKRKVIQACFTEQGILQEAGYKIARSTEDVNRLTEDIVEFATRDLVAEHAMMQAENEATAATMTSEADRDVWLNMAGPLDKYLQLMNNQHAQWQEELRRIEAAPICFVFKSDY